MTVWTLPYVGVTLLLGPIPTRLAVALPCSLIVYRLLRPHRHSPPLEVAVWPIRALDVARQSHLLKRHLQQFATLSQGPTLLSLVQAVDHPAYIRTRS